MKYNQKVYIISKSTGNRYSHIKKHRHPKQQEVVFYKNQFIESIIGYYKRIHQFKKDIYIINYYENSFSGDFYLEQDFIVSASDFLPEILFNI